MVGIGLPEALAEGRARHAPSVLPYLLVDRGRLASTGPIARAIRAGGGVGLELGFPFSDPIADGPLLASASARALGAGTDWSDLLSAAEAASRELPVGVMTYANPVYHHGLARACRALRRAGASALIVPDLDADRPGAWERACHRNALALVRFASPATPPPRLRRLVDDTEGFLYLLARFGTTGVSASSVDRGRIRRQLAAAHHRRPDLPLLLGFGLRGAAEAGRWVDLGADGVIVGSAFESAIGPRGSAPAARRLVAAIARGARRGG